MGEEIAIFNQIVIQVNVLLLTVLSPSKDRQCYKWFQSWSQIREDFAKEENLGKELKNKCQLRGEGDQKALETKGTAERGHI